MKVYHNDNKKYSGELFDILNNKLFFFYDIYIKLGLERYQYYYAFFIILKDQATEFYFNNLWNKNLGFDIIIFITKAYFEIDKN
jgi:hypothetical protein